MPRHSPGDARRQKNAKLPTQQAGSDEPSPAIPSGESEALFRMVVDHAPEAILVYDVDQDRFIEANRSAELLFACGKAELLEGGPHRFYLPPPDAVPVAESTADRTRRALAGETVTFEQRIRTARGAERICEVTLIRLPLAERRLLRINFTDITECDRATQKLEEEEAKFRGLVEQNVAGIVIVREDGTLAYCNAYYAKLAGYTPAEIIGRPLLDFLPEAEKAPIRESLRSQIFERGDFVQRMSAMQARDGRIIDVMVNASRQSFEGRPASIAVVLDITEQKRAERQLKEAEAQLTEAQAVAHVGSWQLDLQNNSVAWSEECYRIFHVDPATFAPTTDAFFARVHPDDRDALLNAHKRSLEDRGPSTFDHRIVLADGTIRFIHQRWKNTYDADGRPLRTIGTIQDVTDWKTAENALRHERDFSGALISAIPAIFAVIDETGHLVRWNKNLKTIGGFSDEELQGMEVLSFIVPSDREVMETKIREAFLHGSADAEGAVRTKAGDIRTIHWTAQTISTDGSPKLVAVGLDITEMREAAERLQASKSKYRELFESTRDAIMVLDASTRDLVSGNPAAVTLFGAKDEAELISHPLLAWSAERQPDGRASAEKLPEVIEPAVREGTNFFDWTYRRADGETFDTEVLLTRIVQDGKELIYGSVRDITERKRTADALAYRDHILHAVTLSAAELVTGASLAAGMTLALKTMAEALHIDRMFILKWSSTAAEPSRVYLLHSWQAADVVPIDAATFDRFPAERELADWQAPLAEGKPVVTYANTATGRVSEIMRHMNNLSTLFVPIFVSGRYWGHIAIDDCKIIRQWTSVEIDTLGTLSELIGAMILREQVQTSLRESEERFRAVSETAQDAIIMSDTTGIVLYWNRSAERILGYTAAEAIGMRIHDSITPPRFRDRAAAGMKKFARTGRGRIFGKTLELAAIRKDGREIPVEISVANMLINKEWRAVAILRDITERKRSEEELARLAREDILTGLRNRAVFVELLKQEIVEARRDNKVFAVLYIDLDHFKDVNDTLGHPIGDLLLQAVADRLRANVRETDTVARFGGDEFALIDRTITEPTDAANTANRLLAVIGEPVVIEGHEIHAGASVGIAIYAAESPDAESLLSHADVALYRAKSEGRGTYRFFTDAMDIEVRRRVTLVAELREAIASGRFFLTYQPQVHADTGRILGVEALVRWNHPTRGMVSPAEFIPTAEKSGLIDALGSWVLREACRQMKEWLDAGIAPTQIGVNVSGAQFKAPLTLENSVVTLLADTGLPPSLLEIELTESILMDVSREHNDVLMRLRKMGVRITIDDFGTGYSSLDYLAHFPVDRIKIAQTFMLESDTISGNNAAIVKAAIGLAQDLNLDVMVEGVETVEQLALIKSWGCQKVQGYYFSPPLSAGDMTAALRTGKIVPV